MKKFILCLTLIVFIAGLNAQIKLPSIFSDNMLLQQQSDVSIWGKADPGKTVKIVPSWDNKTYTAKVNKDGKWNVKITTPAASYQPYTVKISEGNSDITLANVLIGEVWLCSGQSNMEMPMKGFKNQPIEGGNEAILKSKNKNLRLITVKRNAQFTPQDTISGSWKEASPEVVKDFSATAYFFGRLLNEMLDVPVGLVCSAWGGSCIEAWMNKDMMKNFDFVHYAKEGDEIKAPNRTSTLLYNGMIEPIAGYTIKGCIWYQGESNYEDPDNYPALFKTMVDSWRNGWNQGDFPFYYCQIAPYDNAFYAPEEKRGGKFNSAFLREAQLKASTQINNSGMVVLMDIGEERCIHPRKKCTGGERLAMMALGKTYGMSGFGYESPVFKEMTVENGKAVLSFDNAPMWLTAFGKELQCFEIAGEDQKFRPAKAEIKRSKVEVSSPEVPTPVAVRYAFKDFIVGDLFSTEGLPISSFRTDNWGK